MTALSAIILCLCVTCILLRSKRAALFGLVFGTLFLPQGAGLMVAGFSLFPTRILTIIAFLRVIARRELPSASLNKLDYSFIILYVYTTIVLIARVDEGIPYRIAKLTDALTCYLAFRALINDFGDIRWALGALLLLLFPYVLLVGIESVTHQNPFTLLGGSSFHWMRGERVRCFGSFRHPSLLGSVGATFFPLYMALFWDSRFRNHAITGILLSLLLVGLSNSGGPLSALAVAVVGWLFWPLRNRMKLVRIYCGIAITILAVVMNAPIWYLIARITAVTGGTGWHRSYLIDVAFQNIQKWWLFGMPIESTKGWFPYSLIATGGSDITNQFLSFGLSGGLLGMFMFILLLVSGFSYTGRALQVVRNTETQPGLEQRILWGFGVLLAVHMFNFLGITYFDQFYVVWFAQLAALNSAASRILIGAEWNHAKEMDAGFSSTDLPLNPKISRESPTFGSLYATPI